MKNKSFWLVFLSLACASCRTSTSGPPAAFAASSTARNGTYVYCYTTSPSHGITVSSVFRLPAADQVTMLEEPWAKDFRRYVGESGDRGALSVSCDQVEPKNADAAVKAKINAWRKQGIHVVQVSWKYAGG